jgi:ankyrin repeat protein
MHIHTYTQGELPVVECMALAGVDLDATDEEGTCALQIAVMEEQQQAQQLLLELGAKPLTVDIMFMAAAEGNIVLLEFLMTQFDLNTPDEEGNTILSVALECEQGEVAEYLKKLGGLTQASKVRAFCARCDCKFESAESTECAVEGCKFPRFPQFLQSSSVQKEREATRADYFLAVAEGEMDSVRAFLEGTGIKTVRVNEVDSEGMGLCVCVCVCVRVC